MPTITNPHRQNRQGQNKVVFPFYTLVPMVYGLPRGHEW